MAKNPDEEAARKRAKALDKAEKKEDKRIDKLSKKNKKLSNDEKFKKWLEEN